MTSGGGGAVGLLLALAGRRAEAGLLARAALAHGVPAGPLAVGAVRILGDDLRDALALGHDGLLFCRE